ncbi:hydroxymethylbilane synthase [Rubeoparvulum massiliense]|uniref:hydroxymethylbilane synthase n=1 Tax=Rubeoparvulum massiliense TaxID=1631346 RepID=UPI00065E8A39|nr:hydroxymethylbilane synthase [Rubeoparvulum massiliense]
MRTIIVGSRRSQLALTQTRWVIHQLEALGLPFQFQIEEIVTKGDQILDVALSKVGGKGLFVSEIEQALLEGRIDFAVHSMKDMPAVIPDGLMLGAVPKRVDPRDAFISREGIPLAELPQGAVIGTSSLRRSIQLTQYRSDLKIAMLRGNLDTRLRKLKEGQFDAIILAMAGLQRLQWEDVVTEALDTEICLPAVGQGALAIECRADDQEVRQLLQQIHHVVTAETVAAERAFLRKLEGGCQIPIGAFCEKLEKGYRLRGFVADPDGSAWLKEEMTGADPETLGIGLAQHFLDQGAKQWIELAKERM